jgi:hypothetical protein
MFDYRVRDATVADLDVPLRRATGLRRALDVEDVLEDVVEDVVENPVTFR